MTVNTKKWSLSFNMWKYKNKDKTRDELKKLCLNQIEKWKYYFSRVDR